MPGYQDVLRTRQWSKGLFLTALLVVLGSCTIGAVPDGEDPSGNGADCFSFEDLGSVATGDTVRTTERTLTSGERWYQVFFFPDGPADSGLRPSTGKPSISFAVNNGHLFDVRKDCASATLGCGNGASEAGYTDWTFEDQPDCCSADDLTAEVPWPEIVVIRVFPAVPGEGGAFQLELSR